MTDSIRVIIQLKGCDPITQEALPELVSQRLAEYALDRRQSPASLVVEMVTEALAGAEREN